MDQVTSRGQEYPINLITIGDDAGQTAAQLPSDYWDKLTNTGFLGVHLAEDGMDGIDVHNGTCGASLYVGSQYGTSIRDFITAQRAFDPYAESVQCLLAGSHLNIVFSYLGKAFPSGITPGMARASQDEGAVTIVLASLPHKDEGRKHFLQSKYALDDSRENSDALCLLPLELIFNHVASAGSLKQLGGAVSTLFTRMMRGIVDLASRPGFRSPDLNDIVNFFRGSGEVLLGYSEIDPMAHGGGTLEAIRKALEHPLDPIRRFEGAEQILISVCTGETDIGSNAYMKIGQHCRDVVGNNTNIIVGNFESTVPGENPWITVYGRQITDRKNDGFDYPINEVDSKKGPSRLPAYYQKHFGRGRKALSNDF